MIGSFFCTQRGVREAALLLLRTLAATPLCAEQLAHEAPCTALLSLLRLSLITCAAEPLSLGVDVVRFIAATPAARAALLERQRGTLSLRGFAGAGPPGGAGVADLSALMQQLQEVEQLPTALRASAAEVRAHLIGEPSAFLDLPPTARDMTPDDPDAAPAGRGVRSLGAPRTPPLASAASLVDELSSHADEIGAKLADGFAEFGAKLVGGRDGRRKGRRPSTEGAS